MSKSRSSGWREGLSARSIGRFGGWGADYIHNVNGFLALSAKVNELFMGRDLSIPLGRYEPGEPFCASTRANWTTVTHELRNAGGRRIARIRQSLLSPGVLFEVAGRHFRWFNDRSCQFIHFAYPTARGVKVLLSSIDFDEEISEPWVLGLARPTNTRATIPLLFVFRRRPRKVRNINSDFHEFRFSRGAGGVVVMPLFGAARVDPRAVRARANEQNMDIRGGRLPAAVVSKCRFWAKAMLAYPVACREDYRIDHKTGQVTIRNRFTFAEGANDFDVKPQRLAPAPPIFALAAGKQLGVQFKQKLLDTGMLTYLGPYKAARGNELTYTLEGFRHAETTIAPARVHNLPAAGKLTASLKSYIRKPTLTFGGDNTYDASNIQDVLHDFRLLAWAIWSLDETDRSAARKRMLKRLKTFTRSNYRRWREPMTGGEFIAEKEIWRTVGDVTYDYEWYNGMQLAGLWAGMHFLDETGEVRRKIAANWDIVEGLAEYFFMFNDWATGTFWTDIPGEHLWMDGFHFGFQGLCGLYRIAKALGRRECADGAAYLLAKSAAMRRTTWFMADYVSKAMDAGLESGRRGRRAPREIPPDTDKYIVGGFFEREGFVIAPTHSAGNTIGYLVPEQYLLYLDSPSIVERLRKGQQVYLPKDMPDWNKRPTSFGAGRWAYPEHWHFYQHDDQLFVRSLILRQPLAKLLKASRHLNGPVMEAFLVAAGPMAVIPTDARFAGHEWDARRKVQTLRLETPRAGLVVEVHCRRKPKRIEGASSRKFNSGEGRLYLTLPKGEVTVTVQY